MKTMKGKEITVINKPLKVGDKAPSFKAVDKNLTVKTLAEFKRKYVLLSAVPSLDTGVCDFQTRRINAEIAGMSHVDFVTISMDLPFAQARWCAAADLDITTLSDHNFADFGPKYGAYIQELRLLARAVFVLDENRNIIYLEYLDEMTNHPHYDELVLFLKALN